MFKWLLGAVKTEAAPGKYIVEYGGKYWNGFRFVKDKSAARVFISKNKAWEFVDDTFPDDMAEDCSVRTA